MLSRLAASTRRAAAIGSPSARAGLRLAQRSKSYLAAIDQGTSSSRVILYDSATLKPEASHQVELQSATTSPQAGWTQMDPKKIYSTVQASAAGALEKAGATASSVIGVGITNQRESTVVWDKNTGEPLYDVIVWHDARTADTAAGLVKQHGGQDGMRAETGLPISTYFSGVKLRWLLDNVPKVREGFEKGTALFGTIDTWLAWNLTGGAKGGKHVTDLTNASRTMMMDINTCQWNQKCIDMLGVGVAKGGLPQITSCAENLGTISDGGPLNGAPLTASIGDQQSAMVGQRCFSPGQAKITYGTGAFMLVNSGTKAQPSKHGLLTTALYKFGPNAPTQYALEGAVACCAVGINWFKDSLGMIVKPPEISSLAGQVPDGTDGLVFVSAFGGLLAPHWRDDARATLVGLTLAHDKRHVARAVLEGIAFQAGDVIGAMASDTGTPLSGIRVDGGVAMSNELLQYQADFTNISVERPKNVETTAMGAAISAGLGAGVWSSVGDLAAASDDIDRKFAPAISDAERKAKCERWSKAVKASLDWA